MAQLHVSAGDVPLRCITQGAPPFVGPLPPLELVASRPGLGNLAHLRFFDPAHFRAGNIHNKPSIWQGLLDKSPCSEVDLLEVIRDGVRVDRFFRPFKGKIMGQAYDSEHPPPIILKNSPTTAKFSQFVSDSIIQWVTAGVLAVWGPVDSVAPPRLVLPLTVEPSKPRLCHDERYLNLWIRDLPFKLDHLCDLPRYVLPGHFQSSCDDKSGYQHVLLHPSSQTYFGFQWHGFYFVFRTLPFGWKASTFIYHKLGLKDIFDCCREFNFSLDVHYVPSSENPADIPSRKVSDIDCMLSERAWEPVERLFGPHTFDLMSLDSNCQRDGEGRCLPHFTPCATPSSCGINVFAQSLPLDHNLYVFPPFVLIAPLLKCMFEQDFHGAFTIIVPDLKPRRFWWALLQSLTVDRLLLGKKGKDGILLFPSQNSRRWYSKELQWDLWAFRCVC